MKYILYFCLLLILCQFLTSMFPFLCCLLTLVHLSPLDSLIAVYDEELSRSEEYITVRCRSIDSLQQYLAFSADKTDSDALLLHIADLYQPLQCDSALLYYHSARQSQDRRIALQAELGYINMLASVGDFALGLAEAGLMHAVPKDFLPAYYNTLYRLYTEASIQTKSDANAAHLAALAAIYADSLLSFCEADPNPDLAYYRHRITQSNSRRDYTAALHWDDIALLELTEYEHDYAIFAFERAIIFREMGRTEDYKQWLLRSAIADVRCGIRNNGSSWMIAMELLNDGDLDRALRYINYSLHNANIFNAQPRFYQIAPLAIQISQLHEQKQHRLSLRLMAVVILLVLVVLAVITAVIYAYRQNTRLHRLNGELRQLNKQLQESNMVKEQYICRYLEVYSEMINRMARMARKTEKDPNAFLKKEMEVYYQDFDRTFISLYPTFIEDINVLLRPDRRIYPKQGELLTTELRIFALIRLGIDSSAKIAQLLCYAPNTIYNYRAAVRNAAIDKKQFDDAVTRIAGRKP